MWTHTSPRSRSFSRSTTCVCGPSTPFPVGSTFSAPSSRRWCPLASGSRLCFVPSIVGYVHPSCVANLAEPCCVSRQDGRDLFASKATYARPFFYRRSEWSDFCKTLFHVLPTAQTDPTTAALRALVDSLFDPDLAYDMRAALEAFRDRTDGELLSDPYTTVSMLFNTARVPPLADHSLSHYQSWFPTSFFRLVSPLFSPEELASEDVHTELLEPRNPGHGCPIGINLNLFLRLLSAAHPAHGPLADLTQSFQAKVREWHVSIGPCSTRHQSGPWAVDPLVLSMAATHVFAGFFVSRPPSVSCHFSPEPSLCPPGCLRAGRHRPARDASGRQPGNEAASTIRGSARSRDGGSSSSPRRPREASSGTQRGDGCTPGRQSCPEHRQSHPSRATRPPSPHPHPRPQLSYRASSPPSSRVPFPLPLPSSAHSSAVQSQLLGQGSVLLGLLTFPIQR